MLAKIDRPALVIASSASRELDAQKAMASRLTCGAIEVIDGAGHAVFVDQPERFDEVLSAFLRRLDEPCAAAPAEHGSL